MTRVGLLLFTTSLLAQSSPSDVWTKNQKLAANGFPPVTRWGGQAKLRGKLLVGQPYTIVRNGSDAPIAQAHTDQHGHFLVEPLTQGEYIARFEVQSQRYSVKFGIPNGYQRCEQASHVEIHFDDNKKPLLQTFLDINDSGTPCTPSAPECFRPAK